MADRILGAAAEYLGGPVLTALMASARYGLISGHDVESEWVKPRRPAIYLLWHGRLLPCAYHYRSVGLGTLITRNRDGDAISRVVGRWGYRVIRGSSSRGGATALRKIVRVLQSGTPVALTPDGPRGPRQTMKTGPLLAAQQANVPIIPVSAGAAGAWYFGRWDRFLVPKPFTRIRLALGAPVFVPGLASQEELEALQRQIERTLNGLTEFVDRESLGGGS